MNNKEKCTTENGEGRHSPRTSMSKGKQWDSNPCLVKLITRPLPTGPYLPDGCFPQTIPSKSATRDFKHLARWFPLSQTEPVNQNQGSGRQ